MIHTKVVVELLLLPLVVIGVVVEVVADVVVDPVVVADVVVADVTVVVVAVVVVAPVTRMSSINFYILDLYSVIIQIQNKQHGNLTPVAGISSLQQLLL